MSLKIRISGRANIFASAIRFAGAVGAVKGGLSWHGNPDRQHNLVAAVPLQVTTSCTRSVFYLVVELLQ